MKKISLLLIAWLAFGTVLADDYKPMVREGVKWVYFIHFQSHSAPSTSKVAFITYEFKDEVEMNGHTYKKCWRTVTDEYGLIDPTPRVVAYAREEDKKVYAIYDEEFIAQNRDYNAGYYEYDVSAMDSPQMRINIQGIDQPALSICGMEWTDVYPDYTDEYLIYDFNDLPDFYAHYPHKVYHCGPMPYLTDRFEDVPNSIITETRSCTVVDTIALGDGRVVKLYKVVPIFSGELEQSPAQAPAQSPAQAPTVISSSLSVYNGDGRLAIDGYGMVTIQTNRPTQIFKRSLAASINRSFISPDAMLRHIDTSILNPDAYNFTFGFCHIEDNGVKVIEYKYCDIFHGNAGIPRPNTAVEDVEAVPAEVPSDGLYYDMQGRAVAEPTEAGIYVRNGKKVVVR